MSAIVQKNNQSIQFKSSTIKTLEEVIEEAKIDLSVWEVTNFRVNKWDCSARTAKRNGFITTELWQIKVDLKRKVPNKYEDAIQTILDNIKKYKITYPKKPNVRDNDIMLEISLFDVHFGKLAWGLETGTNYDSDIAAKIYAETIQTLVHRAQPYGIKQILFPIGQDFFNCDNWSNTTNKGTPQDVDTRFQKVFDTGVRAVKQAIDYCLNIAPVEILWVPGNHDTETSWYLVKVIEALYHDSGHRVVVDSSPMSRKYKLYGSNLIGFTHGNEERFHDLPNIMAAEVPSLWAQSEFRSWHVGHYHRRKQINYTKSDTFNGVRVEIIPSISGTDNWHYKKGFIQQTRAAEAHLWSLKEGYIGYLTSTVRDWL